MTGCEILSFFVHIFATIIVRHREELPLVLHFTGVAISAGRNFLPAGNRTGRRKQRMARRNRREKARMRMAGRNFERANSPEAL
jgi:hypothetical protein